MSFRLSRDGDEFGSLTVVQLRQQLKKRGLITKGLKKELIKRLREGHLNEAHAMDASTVKQRTTSKKTNGSNGELDQKAPAMESDIHNRHKAHERERAEREKIVLWKHPMLTLQYFLLESLWLIRAGISRLWKQKKMVALVLVTFLFILAIYHTPGSHQKLVSSLKKNCVWWSYWVGLGILSSVGLGTGLHTFVLYLGPHIATVTLAAYECMSVNFPEPPYPNEIICPDQEELSISLWTIMSKVRIEAIMWGAGTAIGELPPYFMARAARLSGQDTEDEELEELEELIMERKEHPDDLSFLERLKLGVHNLIQKVGFFGILACASIPNPLFDLAGITCGHFLVPFWTFFGATLIGKAIIKMHIQKLFVIFIFSEKHVEQIVSLIRYVPKFGPSLQTPFQEWLRVQKSKLHHDSGTTVESGTNVLAWIFEKVIIVMVVYFLLSIINSMAQSYHKRHAKERQVKD